jgi:CheY-like chemotaxis protein
LTARVFPHEQAEAMAAGFDAFIRKPCLPDNLLDQVRPFLGDGAVRV